jgi:hypothetical protein
MNLRHTQFPFLSLRYAAQWLCCFLLLLSGCLAGFTVLAEDQWQGVERIVAVGDIHGDYDNYIEVLRNAGIINRRGNWDADETHFVQMGDLPDRGPDTDKIIEHMQQLERQAQRAGGAVHALIGNHEVMNIAGDLRYVHPGEYEALTNRRSRALRESYYERVVEYLLSTEEPPVIDEAFKQQWEQETPLGYVEHRNFWNPAGEFGQWVVTHNTVIKINNVLFVHGGISPAMLSMDIRQINDTVRNELLDPQLPVPRISETEDGPLWYRGLASNEESVEAAHVDAILARYEADYIVVGHTPGYGTVVPRFDSRVLLIDTGISQYYGAYLASLLVENDQFFTNQRGEKIRIPESSEGLLDYYQQIAEVEPSATNLRALINSMNSSESAATPAN